MKHYLGGGGGTYEKESSYEVNTYTRLLTIFFLMQGTKLNKDIPINEASGVHSGHMQTTHYSSEGEDKSIYTFCITI